MKFGFLDKSKKKEVPSETPPDYGPQIEFAQSLGFELYILDKASAIGTDVMFENVSDFNEKKLGGYLTFRKGNEEGPIDAYLVSFYTNDQPPKIMYEVHVGMNNQNEFNELNPPRQASPDLSRLAIARNAAIAAIPQITQPINPVTFPGQIFGRKGVVVYILAGATEPNVAVFGKHYRAYVDPDNDYAVEIEPLSKSALEIPIHENCEGLYVTQIVTDWPTEIHVFASLLYQMKIWVLTESGVWEIDGANIAFLGKNP